MEVGDVRMTRLRVLHVLVQPVFVLDDGEELQPGPTAEAFQATLAQLGDVGEQIRSRMPEIEQQVFAAIPPDGFDLPAPEAKEPNELDDIEHG